MARARLLTAHGNGKVGIFATGLRRLVAALAAYFFVFCAPANAAGRYAAMVIDANTGAVISAHAADEPRYPASLTKMMTLYVVFDLIEQGRLSYQTKIRVSPTAAATAPSKLGLEPGAEIALIDAVKALITKSANDMAVAIAEHIAGSEPKFAALMTQKARHIGMASTTFKNAHGLPDGEQVTTARDMVTLGLRLQDDFPKHYPLFSTREFRFAGDTHRNHNTLLFHYDGTNGIKTGYTSSSGFNLVANVRRGSKHVMGVVFGGASAAARNQNMRTLLNIALLKGSVVKTRQPALIARARPVPSPRPAPRPEAVASAKHAPAPQPMPRPTRADAAPKLAATTPAPATPAPQPLQTVAAPAEPSPALARDPAWRSNIEVARVRPILVAPRQPRQAQLPPQPAAEAEPAEPAALAPTVATFEPPQPTIPITPTLTPRQPLPVRQAAASPPAPTPIRQIASAPPPPLQVDGPGRGARPSTLQAQAQNLSRGVQAVVPASPSRNFQVADNAAASPPTYRLAGPTTQQTTAAAGVMQIQIGAYASQSEAEKRLNTVRQQATDLVGGSPGLAIAVTIAGKPMYRARFAGFDAARAGHVCTELRRRQIDCLVAKAD